MPSDARATLFSTATIPSAEEDTDECLRPYWGYGAELTDPDGYLIRLWDQRSMKEK